MNKPNILVFCSDEEQHLDQVLSLLHEEDKARFLARLKTRTWFREHGVSFDNHHGTSIPCTSARGVMWTGHHAPDTQLVDNMEVPYQISLGAYDPTVTGTLSTEYGPPTLGHMLDALGYYAAFHGKVHLAQDAQLDSTDAMWKRYGFHDWTGTLPLPMVKDMEGTDMGHLLDPVIAEKAVNWLHDTAPGLTKPWALVVSFINPHDTMLVDIDGKRSVQKMQTPSYPIAPSPYREWWNPKPPPNFAPNFGVQDTGPRPQAHDLWASICSVMFGNVPFGGQCEVNAGNRKIIAPMWQAMINHYLNCIIDNDEQMWKVLRAWLLEPGLAASRRNTVLLLTSDHGDMMMSHGAVSSWYQDALGDDDGTTASSVWMPLRQKGPFIYRENYRLPLVIASPSTDYVPNPGSRVPVLSNHLDLVPTLLGYAGAGAGGKSIADWYWQTYGAWLKRLAMPIGKSLCGFDLGPVAKTPSAYPQPQWGKRTALLFTYDTINTLDPQAAMQSTRGLNAEQIGRAHV